MRSVFLDSDSPRQKQIEAESKTELYRDISGNLIRRWSNYDQRLKEYEPTETNITKSRMPATTEATILEWREGSTVYEYVEIDDECVGILSCSTIERRLAVPSKIDGKSVTEIGPEAFRGQGTIVELIFPPDVTFIGTHAFNGCSYMTSLTLPKSIEYFDNFWVHGCASLARIEMPDALKSFGAGLFNICGVREIAFGSKLEQIERGAFLGSKLVKIEISEDNPYFKSVDGFIITRDGKTLVSNAVQRQKCTIPQGCEVISMKAFSGDSALIEVEFPSTLIEIEPFSFLNSKVERIICPQSLRAIDTKAFFQCRNLAEVSLNEGLEHIGDEAFAKTAISSLRIPASVCDIGHRTIELTRIAFDGERAGSFEIDERNEHYLVDGFGGLYKRVEGGLVLAEMLNMALREYTCLEGTVEIGDFAFLRNKSIASVTIGEGLGRIGDSAFRGASKLASCTFPRSLASIGKEAFFETALKSVYISESLVDIGENALLTCGNSFYNIPGTYETAEVDPANPRYEIHTGLLCDRLPNGTLYAVQYLCGTTEIVVDDEIAILGPYTFVGANRVTSIEVHDKATTSGMYMVNIGCPLEHFRIRFTEPIEGREMLDLELPGATRNRRIMVLQFLHGALDITEICKYADNEIFTTASAFERGRMMLERLTDPIFMDPNSLSRFDAALKNGLPSIVRAFAERDFFHGFDLLADQGYLTESNIDKVIGMLDSEEEVATTGYLLNMKHERFERSHVDFSTHFDI
ncbi:MAG: leucine-rich repeat domain-containing protein [bacterium]|nr:leucine-rich repeat domain-containing protein [bacterium]